MGFAVYLADVEDPARWDTTEQVLVIFLESGSEPPRRLIDPDVVGLRSAEGTWNLLLWERAGRRAFYERVRSHADGSD